MADPEAAPDEEMAEAKLGRVKAKERTAVRDAARAASPAPASLIGNISQWVSADGLHKRGGEAGGGVKRGAAVFLLIPLILGVLIILPSMVQEEQHLGAELAVEAGPRNLVNQGYRTGPPRGLVK